MGWGDVHCVSERQHDDFDRLRRFNDGYFFGERIDVAHSRSARMCGPCPNTWWRYNSLWGRAEPPASPGRLPAIGNQRSVSTRIDVVILTTRGGGATTFNSSGFPVPTSPRRASSAVATQSTDRGVLVRKRIEPTIGDDAQENAPLLGVIPSAESGANAPPEYRAAKSDN